ncbi:MAG TPA: transposase [Candidatus Saccharimonadia bacterium]|nr:transposase [Candidatus Saccharimonadia bacterium]
MSGAVSLERLEQDANGDLVYTFTHPWSDGTTGIRLSPMELLEKLAALVPLPRVHLVRYGGCLAPHSHLRGAIIPTPRQQGVDTEATDTGSLCWRWARLLKRVFALDMARCPWCQVTISPNLRQNLAANPSIAIVDASEIDADAFPIQSISLWAIVAQKRFFERASLEPVCMLASGSFC